MTLDDHPIEDATWIIRGFASTRPVKVAGAQHATSFSAEMLESLVQQARDNVLPVGFHHLDFLPPIGRITDGRIVKADDGELDLEMFATKLPVVLIPEESLDNVVESIRDAPESDPIAIAISVAFEERNFEPKALEAVSRDAPVELGRSVAWSALPPIIWTIPIAVTWGVARFAGAFIDEFGKTSARRLSKWMSRSSKSSIEPDRDRLVSIVFKLQPGVNIFALIPVRFDDPDDIGFTVRGLESATQVAEFAGLQFEQDLLPDMKRAVFVFDGTTWRLSWWTDGRTVFTTPWLKDSGIDPERFLSNYREE